jgi:hypothetical protein
MDAHIDPQGWDAMVTRRANGERVMLPPEAARLYEHDTVDRVHTDHRRGASSIGGRSPCISREQVLGGWVPQI